MAAIVNDCGSAAAQCGKLMAYRLRDPCLPEAMTPEGGGGAASNYYLTVFGKPEAYRTVLRQSR
jgi:hypothetical protein